MSDTNPLPDYPRGISFEQVWAALMETREQQKETDRLLQETRQLVQENALRQKETDRQIKETDRQMKETDLQMKETDRRINKVSKEIGRLGNSIGGIIETLMAARLWEKFSAYSYKFKRAYRRVMVYDDETNRALTEIDILLSDTDWVMAVEVKHEVDEDDVEHHLKRMELIRKHPPAEARGKKLIGAMAGGTVSPSARDFAYKSGFFALELRGESVDLIPPPEGFSPTEWRLPE